MPKGDTSQRERKKENKKSKNNNNIYSSKHVRMLENNLCKNKLNKIK